MEFNTDEALRGWADEIECAVTICDTDCRILYMNQRSRQTFARHGDIIGHDLMQYHPPRAQELIRHMLATGDTPWRRDGKIAGLVEFSIVLPADMPHYDRG